MSDETPTVVIPANFPTIIRDFTVDLTTTFPEYSVLWRKWSNIDLPKSEWESLFKYCAEVYPERFFDILYQNDDIFAETSEINVRFLPTTNFRPLYNCPDITDTTRSAIWKYLQLILMTVLNSVRDKSVFGDTASMFEGVNEADLQEKLNATLDEIGDFFKHLGDDEDPDSESAPASTDASHPNSDAAAGDMPKATEDMPKAAGDMPNADDIHEHLKGLFDGKIGNLAKELAEEISQDVEGMFDGEGLEGARTTGDVLRKMIKDPKKIMGLMKTISGKLQDKMRAGEISEEEIMKEAGDLMGKMKGMKGMGNMGEMFKHLAKGMGGGKGVNMGALNKMQKQMMARERMLSKLEAKQAAAAATKESSPQPKSHIEKTADPSRMVFRLDDDDDVPEYSTAPPKPQGLSEEELVSMFTDAKEPVKKSSKKSKKSKK